MKTQKILMRRRFYPFWKLYAFTYGFLNRLVVESDSPNAVSEINAICGHHWTFFYYFRKIKFLSSSLQEFSQYVGRSANRIVVLLPNKGTRDGYNYPF